jgi:hypothetical protein
MGEMSEDWQLTQLKAQKLEAILRLDFKEANRIDREIERIQNKQADLVQQLWPGAKVGQ